MLKVQINIISMDNFSINFVTTEENFFTDLYFILKLYDLMLNEVNLHFN